MNIVITGGAGFVGSSLACRFKAANPTATVTACDNLKRRGSELILARLRAAGVAFVHGDVRVLSDIEACGPFDLLLECSAEPSVHAGYGGSPDYVVQTNLVGTYNCLEAARRHGARVVFLSTSRVYPIAAVQALPLQESGKRLVIKPGASGPGWSEQGITTDFPLSGSRSLYGATKLCSEHLAEEYAAIYGLGIIVNRCGVLAGPWQMGKVDQGFLSLWCIRHIYGGKLMYTGFGGQGYQVRDVLHVDDLYDLLAKQVAALNPGSYALYNAGGGNGNAISPSELTDLCRQQAGALELQIGADPTTKAADIPWYVTDNAAVTAAFGWRPQRDIPTLVGDVFAWLRTNRAQLEPILTA